MAVTHGTVTKSYLVRWPGYEGPFAAVARGLVTPSVIIMPFTNETAHETYSTTTIYVNVPAGTSFVRFALFEADVIHASECGKEGPFRLLWIW